MIGPIGPIAAALFALAGPARPQTPSCPPPVPDSATARWGQVFIDDKKIGALVKVKREGVAPETYEIVDSEPPALKALPVAKIDLIQYSRGGDAERRYGLCPGVVAIVITTKKSGRGSKAGQ
jgi:hypothetical protein